MTAPEAPPYNPDPVPERHLQHPSIRDDVRRTLRTHSFTPSATLYTSIADIYALYLRDTGQAHEPAHQERFRSALGRVLRPPRAAGAYALSFAADVRRFGAAISMVSPDARTHDPRVEGIENRTLSGRRRRDKARGSEEIAKLREARREKKLAAAELPPAQKPYVSFRYVDEFVALNCAEDLIRLKLFPNGKELAESMSAYAAVRSHLHQHAPADEFTSGPLSFRDRNVVLLAVGDGVTPRTAGLFAFRTAWRCVSVDPAMRAGAWEAVANLATHRARVQDLSVAVRAAERVVVVLWHAHVSIRDSLACLEFEGEKWDVDDRARSRMLRSRVAVVSCACCNYDAAQKTLPDGSPPDEEFVDLGVPGLMRTVRVWRFSEG